MFALGRAQELLLILGEFVSPSVPVSISYSVLDEYWASHPELHDVPIYYASALAQKCMAGKEYCAFFFCDG